MSNLRDVMMVRELKAITAVSIMLACTSANAATVEVSNNYFVGSSRVSAVVPQAPDVVGPILTNTVNKVYNDISGTLVGSYRSPWQWTRSLSGVEYESFGKFTSVQANASGEISFGNDAKTLQLVWGSPDKSNKLEFIDDGVTVATVTGGDIAGSNVGVNFIKLTLVGGAFDAVRFSSGANAFEIAKVSAQLNDLLATRE